MVKKLMNIAIDGPAGAGKSTIAKKIAGELGFIYVDTGAMYRAMALHFMRLHVNLQDIKSMEEACSQAEITIQYLNGNQQVLLNGENVTDQIREEEVGKMASNTSVYQPVRQKLVELQQKLASSTSVVMDGRDIGTCVLPDAAVKIYLTADSRVRALRRCKELTQKGIMCNLEEIEQDIIERDDRDMHRELSPLSKAEDAIVVDSSEMTVEQAVQKIIGLAHSRGLKEFEWK